MLIFALEQCKLLTLYAKFPTIITNCGGNVAKAFHSTLKENWFYYDYHLIHDVMKSKLESLKNHATNATQHMACLCQEAWIDQLCYLPLYCCINVEPMTENMFSVLHVCIYYSYNCATCTTKIWKP